MLKDKRQLITLLVALLLLIGFVLYGLWHSPSTVKPTANTSTSQQKTKKYTHLSIALQGGKPVGAVSDYIVQPGTGLEFSITSDVYGQVSTPTIPAQTITFTQSPLVFHFNAPSKSGVYKMNYLADGSDKAITIGIVTVRSTK